MNRSYFILFVWICMILCLSCSKNTSKEDIFQLLKPDQTGITFNNKLHETDSLNILTYLYYYNGGGVAIGDINNDGLPDIYFSGNQVDNKLYLNKGKMQFRDITDQAGVSCRGSWNTGVSMADVNGDGLLDIYVCQVQNKPLQKGRNQLFINNGNLTFTESAALYGLDFSGLATQAAFFDYDRDGDLDCYLLNHSTKDPEQFKPALTARQMFDPGSGDRLMENDHNHYTDASVKAGIFRSSAGFGLGIAVGDLNRDGWPDVYIGNDFHENDYLYINNRDGTFREVISQSTGHTSDFTMGVAIADINNDSWPDILSLDMKPNDEKTYKLSAGWESFNIYDFKHSFGYHHQNARNALQINQGLMNDVPVFSELACEYGIEATDWSWSPLIADFNEDGKQDLFISNGIERRPNDLDFVNYYSGERITEKSTDLKLINTIPRGGVSNYLFLGVPDSNSFRRVSMNDVATKITNGASFSDLDLDGDLDIICNNLNQEAYILQNNTAAKPFISIRLKQDGPNTFALGAQIRLFQPSGIQYQYLYYLSGFESTKEPLAYFATGGHPIDSLVIQWPDGNCQTVTHLSTGYQVIEKNKTTLHESCKENSNGITWTPLAVHHENPPSDLDIAKWIPFSMSSFGPRIATGKKYYYITDASMHGTLHQLIDNKDVTSLLDDYPVLPHGIEENDAALADFNGDGLEDLLIIFGGNVIPTGNGSYQPLLFLGELNGSFHLTQGHIPSSDFNSSIVRPCDFDQDGDLDLFIGTLSRPEHYGWSEPSNFYVNDGKGYFTIQESPVWELVYDAQWQDMDQDSLQDLVVAGHWMPVTILFNRKTHWEKVTIPFSEGLWFTLRMSDLNHDSIPDIMAGNFGLNQPFESDTAHPLILYLNDFDLNGQSDPMLSYMKGEKRFLYPNLELFLQLLPNRKKDFVFNKDFAGKEVNEIFPENQLDQSTQRKCYTLSSGVFLSNSSTNSWQFKPFPASLQCSPIWSICEIDKRRYAFGGNFYQIDPNWGRQDAMFLTVMNYSSEKEWQPDEAFNKAFHRRSEIRDLIMIRDRLYIASNNDTLVSIIPGLK